MSKELTEMKDDLLGKLREVKADTGEKLKRANALYEKIGAEVAQKQKELTEAGRLMNIALKGDLDATKELMALEGKERTYSKKALPAPKVVKPVRAHQRIVRARTMPTMPTRG